MNIIYRNEYDEYISAKWLATDISGTMALIVIDDDKGWCSISLIEEL